MGNHKTEESTSAPAREAKFAANSIGWAAEHHCGVVLSADDIEKIAAHLYNQGLLKLPEGV